MMKRIAAGICPQGLSAGDKAPNTCRCTVISGGTGIWLITVDDPTIAPGDVVLIPAPGSGSNIPKGISFGQTQQVANAFAIGVYRNDTGALVDVEMQFIVVRFRPGS